MAFFTNRAGIAVPPPIRGFLLGSRTVVTTVAANSYTPPAYSKLLYFQLQGPGGGGRNCANSSAGQIVAGGGGGSGEYAELLVQSTVRTWTITITAGGASGGAGSSAFITAPTNSDVSPNPVIWCQAGGGSTGGVIATGTSSIFGSSATGGQGGTTMIGIRVSGRPALSAYRNSGTVAWATHGANSYFGGGGNGRITHGAGNNAGSYGAGGGGGLSINAGGAVAGGTGGGALCIVWEYY